MPPAQPSAQEVLDGIACYNEALARQTAAGRGSSGRADRPAMKACKGDPRSMGHAGRSFPPGPLPEGIPVGFCLKSRAAGFVGGLFTTTMHGIELEERRNGVAVTLVAGGNYNNRIVECGGLMEDQLGAATCIIEGQGGQQANNGVQVQHQSFESSGNSGMRRAQEAGSPVRLWLKASMPNDQLKEQYGLCYTGQWKVTDSWLWTNPRDGFSRCRFLLQRLPGQAPMPRRPLYVRGESGAKRANQLQRLCTEALWEGGLGGCVLADVCSKCWHVSNYHQFATSFGIDLGRVGKGRRRRSGGSSDSGDASGEGCSTAAEEDSEPEEGGERVVDGTHPGSSGSGQQAGGSLDGEEGGQAGRQRQRGRRTRPPPLPRPNIICSSCHVAEVCHSCLADAAFQQCAATDEPWLCAHCDAAAQGQPTAGIPFVCGTPAVVAALAKQAAAALAGFRQRVVEGSLEADARREQEVSAAVEQWQQRAQRLGLEGGSLPATGPAAAGGQEADEQREAQSQQPAPAQPRQQHQVPSPNKQQPQAHQRHRQWEQQQQGAAAASASAVLHKRPLSEQAAGGADSCLATPAAKRPAASRVSHADPTAGAVAAAAVGAATRGTPATPVQADVLPPVGPGSAQAAAGSAQAQQQGQLQRLQWQQAAAQPPGQPAQKEQPARLRCADATCFVVAAHDAAVAGSLATARAAAPGGAAGAAGTGGAAGTAGDEEREGEMLDLLFGLLDLLEGRVGPADLLAFAQRFKGGSSTSRLGLTRRRVLARQLRIAAGQGGSSLLDLLCQPVDPPAAGSG